MAIFFSNHYCSLLKLCGPSKRQIQAKTLHCHMVKTLITIEPFLYNILTYAYSILGNISYARNIFDHMPQPNLFSWNIILSAYSKSGSLSNMKEIFDIMPLKDCVSWNSLLSGYACYGSIGETIRCYTMMLMYGYVHLSSITFYTMLVLASNKRVLELGMQIHGHIMKIGFMEYVFVGNRLINMYAKMGLIYEANRIFNEMPAKNVVTCNTMIMEFLRCGKVADSETLFHNMVEPDSISWTSMITGLIQNRLEREAIGLFREMRWKGMAMDQFTFGSILTACGRFVALEEGKQVHAFIIRSNYNDHLFVSSALVDMYCKCNCIPFAEAVFKRIMHKNIISWTAMLVGYRQNGLCEEAVRIFGDMQRNGIVPDDYTLGSIISSCANLASLEEGTQFHARALISGLIHFLTVSNALITLYGKCGIIQDSLKLFNEMNYKDEFSWTALVYGYAQFGKAKEAVELFEKMKAKGLKPDRVTFIGVLSACSRAGFVERGCQYFESMPKDHGIIPVIDHYTCMIDLYGRAGKLEEAKTFIKQMPFPPDSIGWVTLLSSCRFYNNIEIGKWAAESLMELEPQNPAGYLLFSYICAEKGKWDEVARLRKGMREKGATKEPGCSWIKHNGKVHIFSANDQSNPFYDQIYVKLEELTRKMIEKGYQSDASSIPHFVEELERIKMVKHHSEKLAIAFGLIFIPSGMPIRVVKNLRVCGDCHNATKYISEISGREILVRDVVRYHLFKDGICSCGDFW